MENSKFLEELKFGQGDGNLQYYLYNWRCPKMSPEKVSISKVKEQYLKKITEVVSHYSCVPFHALCLTQKLLNMH